MHFVEFFLSQFGVFGPVFAALLLLVVLGARQSLKPRPAALLAAFALPTLAMMLVVSFISHAQPNWSAPAYVSAIVLVVAWMLARGWRAVLIASIALNAAVAVAAFSARPAALALGYDLPGRYDPLHRLRGWSDLGLAVSRLLEQHPGALLLSDDREDLAVLTYYVFPHPFDALKWNGESGKINDQFDLEADPVALYRQGFPAGEPPSREHPAHHRPLRCSRAGRSHHRALGRRRGADLRRAVFAGLPGLSLSPGLPLTGAPASWRRTICRCARPLRRDGAPAP